MEKEKTEDQDNNKEAKIVQKKKIRSKKIQIKRKNSNEEKVLRKKLSELEEKIVRQYAEMENQRRRYEKEKEDAFEYGGFSFAKETLNLIDNLRKI